MITANGQEGQRLTANGKGQSTRLGAFERAVVDYYDEVWVKRLSDGHNPVSQAMHYGLYDDATGNDADPHTHDIAKLAMNLHLEEAIRTFVDGGPELRIVDAGCGVGGVAVYLASRNPSWTLVGLNIGEVQLGLAQANASRAGVRDHVSFRRSAYEDMPIADASVQAVYFVESLCHSQKPERALAEAARVLAPGGALVLLDFFRTARPLDRTEAAFYEDVRRGFVIPGYFDRPIGDAMQASGLVVERVVDLSKRVQAGVDRSARRARARQAQPRSARERAHDGTCIGISELLARGALAYWSVVATRPR
ncbi:MAG: class I SAM-dependent methyltransferase [Polyangiaceae bacterium]